MYRIKNKYIPERMMRGIENYVQRGIIPGNFLQAVICNNMQLSFRKADDENFENMAAFAGYFYWEVPVDAWGSYKAMLAWNKRGGLEGGK